MPNMTTLAITRSTTALAALYSVQINNNLVALYETAEPLACQQAVRVTAAPDAPIARVELEVRYRNQNITVRCTPPAAAPSSTLSVVFNGTAELDCRWKN